MAESAFGIDHGEVSKAGFKMPGSFRPKNPLAGGGSHRAAGPAQMPKPQFAGAAKGFARGVKGQQGPMSSRTGQAGQQAGQFGRKNIKPIAAGAGAAGIGYTGYKVGQPRKRPGQV